MPVPIHVCLHDSHVELKFILKFILKFFHAHVKWRWNTLVILWHVSHVCCLHVRHFEFFFKKKKISERELVMLDFEIFWHEVAMLFVYVNMYMPGHACHVEFILFSYANTIVLCLNDSTSKLNLFFFLN